MGMVLDILVFLAGMVAGSYIVIKKRRRRCRRQTKGNPETVKKKWLNKIDKILLAVGVATVIFIGAMIYLFATRDAVPDSLVVGFFGAVFGEVSICGWVKSAVEKNKTNESEEI